jgi:branched-chain amino acid transport system substrate-binding protein
MSMPSDRIFRVAIAALGAACLMAPARAADPGPIRIGVIAEQSAIAGTGIANGAQMAADEINAAGGVNGRKIELVIYDDKSSSTDAVRAFQRAVSDDHVVAVVGSYISEVALALQPWASRLKVPYITPGASSTEITRHVHEDYDRNKYSFQTWMTSFAIADSVCDSTKAVLLPKYGFKKAVIFSEDAAWTTPLDAEYLECLPKIGIEVVDHIRFAPDTTDFTPLYNRIEGEKPDVIISGTSHVGVQPVTQWAQQQVPLPMIGQTSQATSGTFWNDTNGSTQGLITMSAAAEGDDVTPRTAPFMAEYAKRFGVPSPYTGFSSNDSIHLIAEAVARAGSTEGDKLVEALEKSDYVGNVGRVQFYGREDRFTHGIRYGEGFITGVAMQWQNGKQVMIWPQTASPVPLQFPSFVHLPPPAT